MALLEWLQATHPEPKVAAALKDPAYRLVTTTAEKIASRRDPWDPASVEADNSGRERLLAEAQAELDRQIGLTRVKEQIEAYRAATQMAKIRAARGMKVAQTSKHMIFTGPPGTGKTTIARVVANILAGLGVIAEPKLVETSRKDFVAEYEGQSAVKTSQHHRPRDRRGAVHRRGLHAGAGARRTRATRSAPRRWTRCWPGWRTTATGWW